jgi:membrane protease YdiL (CAAX protease family)
MVLWMGSSEKMQSENRIAVFFMRDVLFWIALVVGVLICVLAAWEYGLAFDVARPLHEYDRFFMLVVAYPLMEEVVFRGALQGWLLDFAWGRQRIAFISLANVITSLVFAGLHGFSHPALMAALVFVPSIVFGLFRDRTGSIAAPVILHSSYNLAYFWLFGL